MGYCTHHKLKIEPEDFDLLRRIITSEDSEAEIRFAVDEDGSTYDSCKWYEYDSDMRELSKKWPDVTFHLHGEGKQNNDIWSATYKNGLCHHRRAQIFIEPYDPSKLE